MNTQVDLTLVNKVIALTDRVQVLKQRYLDAVPHLCAERSRLVTEGYKETEGQPLDIRRAKMFKKIMDGLSVVIRDGELIVGSQTKYVRGAGPAVDYNPEFVLELFEADRIMLSSLVRTGEVEDWEKESLKEDAAYWKGRSTYDSIVKMKREVLGEIINDLEESRVFMGDTSRPVYSRLPNIEKVINKGLYGIIAEAQQVLEKLTYTDRNDINRHNFLKAVIISCEGAINFARRYAALARELAAQETDIKRKKELETIAQNCEWVPANPARTFYEAVQSLWLTFLCVNLESSFSSEAPGRVDQYLYPYYKKDLEEGRITRQDAAELLGCLWVKFSEMDNVRGKQQRAASQANQVQDLTIGGVTSDGKDASNELTYLILEVARQLKTHQPPVYLRIHKNTPLELWMKAAEVNLHRGDGVPAFINDDAVLLNLVGKDIPIQDARNWAATACVKPEICYGSSAGLSVLMNLAKVLELTLNNGRDPYTGKQVSIQTGDPRDFSTFEELYEAFKTQIDHFVTLFAKAHSIVWMTHTQNYSLPFYSALVDDCIQKGTGYMSGGVRYPQLYFGIRDRGLQDATDSLAAIKKFVYDDKSVGMGELLEALSANFLNREDLRQKLLTSAPKYGNDDDYVDDIFNDLSLWIQKRIYKEKHIMGPNMTTNRSGASFHYYFGKTVGALPNGRKAYQPLADGSVSPVQGADRNGPTAVINSASKVNHTEICRSTLFNMKITPSTIQTKEGIQKFIALIRTYFDRGGYHVQFNLLNNKTLLEAKEHPEKYRDLLVRVAGYSAYFIDLSPDLQDEIISRTLQEL